MRRAFVRNGKSPKRPAIFLGFAEKMQYLQLKAVNPSSFAQKQLSYSIFSVLYIQRPSRPMVRAAQAPQPARAAPTVQKQAAAPAAATADEPAQKGRQQQRHRPKKDKPVKKGLDVQAVQRAACFSSVFHCTILQCSAQGGPAEGRAPLLRIRQSSKKTPPRTQKHALWQRASGSGAERFQTDVKAGSHGTAWSGSFLHGLMIWPHYSTAPLSAQVGNEG